MIMSGASIQTERAQAWLSSDCFSSFLSCLRSPLWSASCLGGALVLLILTVRRWRRSRIGWLIVKLYCGGLALFAVGCLPIAAILVSDLLGDIAAPYYHYTLDIPRKFDRVTFPAGSEIDVSPFPPHHVLRGHLGAPTTIAGLRLVGDFAMTDDFAMPRGTVGSGDLAEPRDINVLPCGIGRFSHNIAFVYCNPVRDVRISGFLLRLACRPG